MVFYRVRDYGKTERTDETLQYNLNFVTIPYFLLMHYTRDTLEVKGKIGQVIGKNWPLLVN